MPFAQPYFLDGNSLLDSTSVYLNSALSSVAPDGWYSDGSNIRQLISGVLQPAQPCPACGYGCGKGVVYAQAGTGKYVIQIDTGNLSSSVGAMIIRFNPQSVPDGIIAEFNGITYNAVSSRYFGYLTGTPGLATYLGNVGNDCGLSGLTTTLDVFNWDGTTWSPAGTTDTITIAAGQLALTASDPGDCFMVIPKTSPTPSLLTVTFYGACGDTAFEVDVQCPKALNKFTASSRFLTVEPEDPTFCGAATNINYFVARVGNGTAPYLGLYDMVFLDSLGQTKMPDGYYKTNFVLSPNDGIEVQNGIIVSLLDACP